MHTLIFTDADLLMLLAAMEGHEALMADALRDMAEPDSGDTPAAIDEQRDIHAAAQSLRARERTSTLRSAVRAGDPEPARARTHDYFMQITRINRTI